MNSSIIDPAHEPVATAWQPWQGKAAITFRRQGDRTVPQVQTQAPLKVQRPFYPEGPDICQAVLLHTAGGMVGGDRLNYDLHALAGTHALLTTAAAAKIYSDHPQPAQITGRLRVEAEACVEWLPQEAIVFEGAQLQQSWRVELAAEAHWLGWDIMRLGRTARGERFCRGEVRSRFEVWHGDQLIWVDPQRLQGSEALWQSPHGLNQCPIVATLVWVGALPEPKVVEAVRAASKSSQPSEIGVTRLQLGLLCRYRGHSTGEVRRWFIEAWKILRPYYARPLRTVPRVWPL